MTHRQELRYLFSVAQIWLVILILGYFCTLLGASTQQVCAEPNDLRWDLAQEFEFNWESVRVSASASNPARDSRADANTPTWTVAVSVSVSWNPLRTGGLVIIDTSAPQIRELLDENGRIVECQSGQSDRSRGYDDFGWYWDREGHARTANKLTPFTVEARLTGDSEQRIPASISLLEAYIYAVYGDMIEVDIPFDPNGGWLDTEAAPDLTLLVDPLTPPPPPPIQYVSTLPNVPPGWPSDPHLIPTRPKAAYGSYTYATWVKSETGQRVLGLRDPRYPSSSYAFGDYAVLRTQLYDSRTKASSLCPNQRVYGTAYDGLYGAQCCGEMLQGHGDTFDTIRHIIIVHPVEVKIPFVLRDIPVPSVRVGN
jgi:hypothetical protein